METIFMLIGRLAGRAVYYLKQKNLKRFGLGTVMLLIASGLIILIINYNPNQQEKTNSSISPASSVSIMTCNGCGRDVSNWQHVGKKQGEYECDKCFTASRKKKKEQQNSSSEYLSDGQKCSSCNLGSYSSGFCGRCGGASAERVNQSNSNASPCEYCKGAGFVLSGGIHDYKKVCPSCKGTCKQTY